MNRTFERYKRGDGWYKIIADETIIKNRQDVFKLIKNKGLLTIAIRKDSIWANDFKEWQKSKRDSAELKAFPNSAPTYFSALRQQGNWKVEVYQMFLT